MSEVVSHENNFAPQIAEYINSIPGVENPVTRRDYFEHLTEDDFLDMTQRLASTIRTGDSETHQAFDGEGVSIENHETPDQRDKEALLRETWQTAQYFLHDRNLNDSDALEYAAITTAGGLLYAHPFIDGNGRTSRILSYTIAKGIDPLVTTEKLLQGGLGGEWSTTPPRELAEPVRIDYSGEQPVSIDWQNSTDDSGETTLDREVTESFHGEEVLRTFLETADAETKQLIELCSTRGDDGGLETVNIHSLLQTLEQDPTRGIEYTATILDRLRAARANYVRRYLQAMRSETPGGLRDFQPSEVEINGHERPGRLRQKQITIATLGARAIGGNILPRDEAVAYHRAYSEVYHREPVSIEDKP